MEGVRYEAPETLQAAVALLAGATGAARILAGGTDVIVQMETELIEPALLIDVKKIEDHAADRERERRISRRRCSPWHGDGRSRRVLQDLARAWSMA